MLVTRNPAPPTAINGIDLFGFKFILTVAVPNVKKMSNFKKAHFTLNNQKCGNDKSPHVYSGTRDEFHTV